MIALFTVVLARTGPDILGQISIALAYGALIDLATKAGFTDFLVARLNAPGSRPRRVLAEVVVIQLLLYLLSMLCLTAATVILGASLHKTLVIVLIAAGMGGQAVLDSFFVMCRTRGRQDVEMRIRIPASLAASLYGLACLLLDLPLPVLALFKLVEMVVLGLLVGVALKWKLSWPCLDRASSWLGDWKQSLAFAGMAVCALLYNRSSMYLLDSMHGSTAVGWYNAAWEITETVSTLVSSALLGKVIFPVLARQYATDQRVFAIFAEVIGAVLLYAALPTVYVMLTEGDRVIPLIFGQQYGPSVAVLRALVLTVPAAFLHNLAAYMMISMHREVRLLLVYVSGLVVSLAACVLLIPTGGPSGAAWALSATKVWMASCTVGFTMLSIPCLRLRHLLIAAGTALAAWGLLRTLQPCTPRLVAELGGLLLLLIPLAAELPRAYGRLRAYSLK